jgi:hypothetical protein
LFCFVSLRFVSFRCFSCRVSLRFVFFFRFVVYRYPIFSVYWENVWTWFGESNDQKEWHMYATLSNGTLKIKSPSIQMWIVHAWKTNLTEMLLYQMSKWLSNSVSCV